MLGLSRLKRRIRQWKTLKAEKGTIIGAGSQGIVKRVPIRRGNNERIYAVKHLRFSGKGWGAYEAYAKLSIMKALGFNTVPVLFPTKKNRITMKDLTENGKKKVVDMEKLRMYYHWLLGEPEYYKKVKPSDETMFRIGTSATNYTQLAEELKQLEKKCAKLGIFLGASAQAVMLVIDKQKHGTLIIADVGELMIPKKIITEGMLPTRLNYLLEGKQDYL